MTEVLTFGKAKRKKYLQKSKSRANSIRRSLNAVVVYTRSSYGFSKPTGITEITWQDNSNDSLSSKSYLKMTKKLIMNHGNKLELFFSLCPRSHCQLMFTELRVWSLREKRNHFSSSCHLLGSLSICANRLSTVVRPLMWFSLVLKHC